MKKRILVYLLALITGLFLFHAHSEQILASLIFQNTIRISSTRVSHKNRIRIRDDGAMMARSDTAGETLLLDRIDSTGQLSEFKRLPFRFHQGLGYEEHELNWGENGPFLTACSEKQILVVNSRSGTAQTLTGDELFHSAFMDIHTFLGAYISGSGRWLIVDAVGEKALFERKGGQYKALRRLDDHILFIDFIFSPDGSLYLEKGSDHIALRRTLDGKELCSGQALFGSSRTYTRSTIFAFSTYRSLLYAVKDSGADNKIIAYDFEAMNPMVLAETLYTGAPLMEWRGGLLWYRWQGEFEYISLLSGRPRHGIRLDLDPAMRGRDALEKPQFSLNGSGSRLLLVDYDPDDPHRANFEVFDADKLPRYDKEAFARISGGRALAVAAGGLLVLFLLIEGLIAVLAHIRSTRPPNLKGGE